MAARQSSAPDLERYAGDGYRVGATETREHEAGPAGACVHCASPLRASETVRRRQRFISAFDTNEAPALYFLAQLPRGAAVDSVESARDSLAPAAVHAARARGREVSRQGDVFFIDTALTRGDLIERGAVFARRTQWTRAAAPRAGEVTFVAPLRAAERRRVAKLEQRYARRLWRQRWRALGETALAARPQTGARGSVQARLAADKAGAAIETARENLRRAVFAGLPTHRETHVWRLERAREGLERAVGIERAGRIPRTRDTQSSDTRTG